MMKCFKTLPSPNSEETLSITGNDFKQAPVSGSSTEFKNGWMTEALKTE